MAFTDEYKDYIKSNAWKAKRAQKLNEVGHKCKYHDSGEQRYLPDGTLQKISCSGPLQVHHKHYRTLGNEAMSDLEVLCKYHHEILHVKKKIFGKGSLWTK
jgi:hypothetical protein